MSTRKELEGILVCTGDTLRGAVRFMGTLVYASQLFDYFLPGVTLESFLEDFPPVTRVRAEAIKAYGFRQV